VFIVYLASHGARTPFLAILALRRPRVLLVVLGPALLLVAAARLLGPVVDPATAFGMVALASAPAAQALVPRVGLLGGRRDAAGAFAAGTVGLWLPLLAPRRPRSLPPPCLRRIRCPILRSTFGRVARYSARHAGSFCVFRALVSSAS